MALSSRELIDLADKRLAEVQQKMHPVEKPSSVIFHGHHETDLANALEAMQLYVDQYLMDPTFPWEMHWATHLSSSDTAATGGGGAPSPMKSLAASRRDIDAFIQQNAGIAKSVDAARRGTVEQLRTSVLVHVSLVLRKLLTVRGGASTVSPRRGATSPPSVMDPVSPPSQSSQETVGQDVAAPLVSSSAAAPVELPSEAAVADAPTVAPPPVVPAPPLAKSARHQQQPARTGAAAAVESPRRPWTARAQTFERKAAHNRTPDALRTVIDGVEYVAVNMKIANNVCRPNSARQLNPQKPQEPRVAAMVDALERNAGAVNARDGPILAAPGAVSRWRTESMLSGSPTVRSPTDGADVGIDPNAKVLSDAKPSIRKARSVVAPPSIALAQVPLSGVVHASPRVGSFASNMWGVRDRAGKAEQSRWVLATHQAGGHSASGTASDVARHTQTVSVTSAIVSRPSVGAAADRDAKEMKGSWAPQHDAKWIAPKWHEHMRDDPTPQPTV